jgi:hypothetical protein
MNAKMIIAMCFITLTPGATASAHDKVPIREVTSLLLHRGKITTGRRTPPVPQISCISNCRDTPDTIYCSNVGHDGKDVIWECKSDPAGAVLHDMNVQCEGYDYPDDPYILKGSCGIEFRMASPKSSPRYSTDDPEPNPMNAIIFLLILMALVSCITSDGGGSTSYRTSYSSPGYCSSPSSNFWTGAATGYAVGRSSGGSGSWGGSSHSSWGGGGSSFASTSRR